MEYQTQADGGRTDNDQTAADVLSTIESGLEDSEKVELSDEQMEALGLWGEPYGTRQPTLKSQKAVDPVSWALIDISDVSGRGPGEYVAIETHDKQQGERYTRPYATGIGQIDVASARETEIDDLREAVADVADNREIHSLDDEQLEAILDELKRADVEYVDIALEGNAWAAAFDGSRLWVEPKTSRTEGFEYVFDDIGLSDDQQRVVEEALFNGQQPSHIDSTSSFGFSATVSFKNDE